MTLLPPDPASNLARIRELVAPAAEDSAGQPVFLVDADRTLSPDDTSRTFLRQTGLDPMVIKRRFERDGYCFDAFRFHAEVHVALGSEVFDRIAPQVARAAPLHPGALDFLRAAAATGPTFIVSAGIPHIWRYLLRDADLDGVEVIGGIDPDAPYVLGRAEKGFIAKLFLDRAACVIGVGDSDVDSELLKLAHHAVVVVNHRRNADLLPHLVGHPSLWQVAPNETRHDGIPLLDFPAVARLGTVSPPCP